MAHHGAVSGLRKLGLAPYPCSRPPVVNMVERMFCLVRILKFSHTVLPYFVVGFVVGFCCEGAWAQVENRTVLQYKRGAEHKRGAVDAQTLESSLATAVSPAVHVNSLEKSGGLGARDSRMMAPPSRSKIAALDLKTGNKQRQLQGPAPRRSTLTLPQINSFSTAGAGLAIVLGLFFACAWLMRRSGPKPTSPLPNEAVAVLGRIPLAARNFAHLLQVGNKLVLVSVTPDGVTPITEVTDSVEVQRLLGLCLRGSQASTAVEFHNVLEKLAQEPASGFLGNEATAAYAAQKR